MATLRLHTASDGEIWYGADRQLGQPSGLGAVDFFLRLPAFVDWPSVHAVRFLGCSRNARLLVQVWMHRAARPGYGKDLDVWAVMPALGGRTPAEALLTLWQPLRSDRRPGAWQRVEEASYASYAVAASLNDGAAEQAAALLRYHPVWPFLSFFPGLDMQAAARLIAQIIDPRWHLGRDGQRSRLAARFGLSRRCVARGLFPGTETAFNHPSRLVLSLWNNPTARQGPILARWLAERPSDEVSASQRVCRRLMASLGRFWLSAVLNRDPEQRLTPEELFREDHQSAQMFRKYLAMLDAA